MDATNHNDNHLHLSDNDTHSVGALPSVQAGNAHLAPGCTDTEVGGVRTPTWASLVSAVAGTQDVFAPLIRSTAAGYELRGADSAPVFTNAASLSDVNNATNGRSLDRIRGAQNVSTTDKED